MFGIRSFAHNNHKLLENFSYISVLQLFLIAAPLVTYPYLVRALGKELYGVVLSAQMLASYASIIINFGSNEVCAKHVSQNRNSPSKLSEILSSVLLVRSVLFVACFGIYFMVVSFVPIYREYSSLFLISYLLTVNDVLFPQFFFQGIEQMKFITIINIATKISFIGLVFVVVRTPADYLWVPILYAIGYSLGGFFSLFQIYHNLGLRFHIPKLSSIMVYVKDSSPIFATDLICTIKDKVNYLLVGSYVGMSEVVIYDLGLKLNSFISKPVNIITTVMLPRFAQNHNIKAFRKVLIFSFMTTLFLVCFVNIFMPFIVRFFLGEDVAYLPLRLFLIAPLLLSVSVVIYNNLFVAFGYNKYALYSIVITTSVYVIALVCFLFAGNLSSIYSFITISLLSYFTEFIYRVIIAKKIDNAIH